MSMRQTLNEILAARRAAPRGRRPGRRCLQTHGGRLRGLLAACLLCVSAQNLTAQSMIPNPTFDLGISPWKTSGPVSYDPRHLVRLDSDGRITVVGQFFGQGRNVILFSAAGLRAAESRNARLKVEGGYPFKGSVFGRSFDIPTTKSGPSPGLAPNGPFKSFVWVPVVAPTGNGTGSFSFYTDDEEGVLVDNVYSFFLHPKNHIGEGKAAGLASLSGSFQSTGSEPAHVLNGTSGQVTVTGTLAVAAYAGPSGFNSITFEAGGTAAELGLLLYDFQQGEWVDPRVVPGSGRLGLAQSPAQGWPLGKNFAKVTLTGFHNPPRFIDPDSGTVVMKLTPSRGSGSPLCVERVGGPKCPPQPPPPSVELRNFRLLP